MHDEGKRKKSEIISLTSIEKLIKKSLNSQTGTLLVNFVKLSEPVLKQKTASSTEIYVAENFKYLN